MKRIVTSVIFLVFFGFLTTFGQEGVEYDIKKPAKYENRTLGYEKTDNTKFNVPRRFMQNTITHYNFYYNTNVKLTEILTRAKAGFKDDYTQLLPFYNYTIETTSKDKKNLDSVIDKVNTSILIHDLRNDWNDNMYMLMGRAYFYKNNLDSAHILFQFVNYAYAPREKDGYPIPIGSNSEEGGNAFAVSTNEKRNIAKKAFSMPPSRNESLIWLIRVYIEQNQTDKAAALIDILNHDPNFPNRLRPALHEMQALWFYNAHMYDSAASHLTSALDNAATQAEQARWEYLIAQLYERSSDPKDAKSWYEKAASHTLDPSLEVYARLNAIRQNKGEGLDNNYIQKNLDALKRMARKEIYQPYLDVIYYVSAEMELERNDRKAASMYYKKCIEHATGNGYNRDRAFLKLGWIFMEDKVYVYAKYAYDSVNTTDPQIADSLKILMDRKLALNQIVPPILTIYRQDSLQRIAAMTPEEREDYLKKMIRNYRKQQGLKESDLDNSGPGGYGFVANNTNSDMFGSGTSGEWYFYNPGVKSKGFGDFKTKWGNRPNVDNWFAQSMINKQVTGLVSGNTLQPASANPTAITPEKKITENSLMEGLPLTPEKLKVSRDSVENALFALGRALQDYIPDYQSAINKYDTLLLRFPETRYFQEALFNEYYCYLKLNDTANASRILALMKQKFPTGRYLAKITNPNPAAPDKAIRVEATAAYEKVYEQLIEGKFDSAAAQKLKLDSLYGQKYWTPQLMYVEALYYIHYRYDSIAKVTLNNIIFKFSGTAMSSKAKNTLRVLNERERIENYLRNLHVTRAQEDSIERVANNNVPVKPTEIPKTPPANTITPQAKDSSKNIVKKTDTTQIKKPIAFLSPFVWSPQSSQSVAMVMTKVDPVYVTESRNAFNRYNRENYYGKNYDIDLVSLTDTTKMMVIHGFEDANAALTYMGKVSEAAPREVIPWLQNNKYYFIIIDDKNLETLKTNKDIILYKKFLLNYSPDKFQQFK